MCASVADRLAAAATIYGR